MNRAGLDLSKLVRLKTFYIYTWEVDYNVLDTAYYFLSLLEAPKLETLCLAILHDESDSFGAIDKYLASAKFIHLKEFVVEIMIDLGLGEPFERTKRFIEAQFPFTRERGIMKVRRRYGIGTLPHLNRY